MPQIIRRSRCGSWPARSPAANCSAWARVEKNTVCRNLRRGWPHATAAPLRAPTVAENTRTSIDDRGTGSGWVMGTPDEDRGSASCAHLEPKLTPEDRFSERPRGRIAAELARFGERVTGDRGLPVVA